MSGGFAVVNPDSTLDISAMEAVPLSHLDPHAITKALDHTKSRASGASRDETKALEIEIHSQVYTALSKAVSV